MCVRRAATARRFSLGGEGNALYPVRSNQLFVEERMSLTIDKYGRGRYGPQNPLPVYRINRVMQRHFSSSWGLSLCVIARRKNVPQRTKSHIKILPDYSVGTTFIWQRT